MDAERQTMLFLRSIRAESHVSELELFGLRSCKWMNVESGAPSQSSKEAVCTTEPAVSFNDFGLACELEWKRVLPCTLSIIILFLEATEPIKALPIVGYVNSCTQTITPQRQLTSSHVVPLLRASRGSKLIASAVLLDPLGNLQPWQLPGRASPQRKLAGVVGHRLAKEILL
ncbi:hypothetical protein KC325_g213 [Hortaea werneckii]|nr:hypothetical protein KC325_g213 [Hortaea werneckii]